MSFLKPLLVLLCSRLVVVVVLLLVDVSAVAVVVASFSSFLTQWCIVVFFSSEPQEPVDVLCLRFKATLLFLPSRRAQANIPACG